MNLLLLSEHFKPKVGGTVSYVLQTVSSLLKKLDTIFLLVPVSGDIGSIYPDENSIPGVKIIGVGVGGNGELKYNGEERKALCNWVKLHLIEFTDEHNIQCVHLLFGLFLSEVIDTESLRQRGIKTIHTIHNIPPQECSRTWKGDSFLRNTVEQLRNLGVYYINKKRILAQDYDCYITPSAVVKKMLNRWIEGDKIQIIPHGGAEFINRQLPESEKKSMIRIFTAGGVVPHKNQHLIPEIAFNLKQQGMSIVWDVVGPIRNQRYVESIKKQIKSLSLEKEVKLHGNVTSGELEHCYQNADLYIQLSTEEGFCMTVLAAISYGLPVLAHPAGAIPEMIQESGGMLIDVEDKKFLAKTISHYVSILDQMRPRSSEIKHFREKYTWDNAAGQLINLYHE